MSQKQRVPLTPRTNRARSHSTRIREIINIDDTDDEVILVSTPAKRPRKAIRGSGNSKDPICLSDSSGGTIRPVKQKRKLTTKQEPLSQGSNPFLDGPLSASTESRYSPIPSSDPTELNTPLFQSSGYNLAEGTWSRPSQRTPSKPVEPGLKKFDFAAEFENFEWDVENNETSNSPTLEDFDPDQTIVPPVETVGSSVANGVQEILEETVTVPPTISKAQERVAEILANLEEQKRIRAEQAAQMTESDSDSDDSDLFADLGTVLNSANRVLPRLQPKSLRVLRSETPHNLPEAVKKPSPANIKLPDLGIKKQIRDKEDRERALRNIQREQEMQQAIDPEPVPEKRTDPADWVYYDSLNKNEAARKDDGRWLGLWNELGRQEILDSDRVLALMEELELTLRELTGWASFPLYRILYKMWIQPQRFTVDLHNLEKLAIIANTSFDSSPSQVIMNAQRYLRRVLPDMSIDATTFQKRLLDVIASNSRSRDEWLERAAAWQRNLNDMTVRNSEIYCLLVKLSTDQPVDVMYRINSLLSKNTPEDRLQTFNALAGFITSETKISWEIKRRVLEVLKGCNSLQSWLCIKLLVPDLTICDNTQLENEPHPELLYKRLQAEDIPLYTYNPDDDEEWFSFLDEQVQILGCYLRDLCVKLGPVIEARGNVKGCVETLETEVQKLLSLTKRAGYHPVLAQANSTVSTIQTGLAFQSKELLRKLAFGQASIARFLVPPESAEPLSTTSNRIPPASVATKNMAPNTPLTGRPRPKKKGYIMT